eukprot:8090530-Pyramimonas_sp.AAC.1
MDNPEADIIEEDFQEWGYENEEEVRPTAAEKAQCEQPREKAQVQGTDPLGGIEAGDGELEEVQVAGIQPEQNVNAATMHD